MGTQLRLGDIAVEVVRKNIKNVHLGVYPPLGRVRISAPSRMSLDSVRVFAVSKLGWIKRQQRKFREQDREPQREYLDRESHYVWGKRYLLSLRESDAAPSVELKHGRMMLQVRPGASEDKKQEIVERWYREQLKKIAAPLVAKWEPLVGVKVRGLFVQRMKTKWGGCSPTRRSIRLNTDLAKKPRKCVEYIVLHEIAHLREPAHNARFIALMDRLMPHWRTYRELLNQLPVRHEEWAC